MKTYIILGNPQTLSRVKGRGAEFSYSQRMIHEKCKLALESQQGDLPRLSGALHMDITFFLNIPQSKKSNKRELEGKPCDRDPLLGDCLMVIEAFAQDILFEDAVFISSITAKKVYSLEPRTEFTVREAS